MCSRCQEVSAKTIRSSIFRDFSKTLKKKKKKNVDKIEIDMNIVANFKMFPMFKTIGVIRATENNIDICNT